MHELSCWVVCVLCCRQPTFPVLKALRNTMIYNLGSVAFGSFIIAIIQFVRVGDAHGMNQIVRMTSPLA